MPPEAAPADGAPTNQRDDRVLFVDVRPAECRTETAIESLERAYTHPERHAIVV